MFRLAKLRLRCRYAVTLQVFRLAKLRSVICSHSPFFAAAQLEACLKPPPSPPRYQAALEADSLLEGNGA